MSKTVNERDSIDFCTLHPYQVVRRLPIDNLDDVQIDTYCEKTYKKISWIKKILNILAKIFN